jgi:hypothetical protein
MRSKSHGKLPTHQAPKAEPVVKQGPSGVGGQALLSSGGTGEVIAALAAPSASPSRVQSTFRKVTLHY